MPEDFDAYVADCITIDNQIRAHCEAQDTIPRNPGGQFAPNTNSTNPGTTNAPSTSTGVQPGPMDLSAALKRGPLTAAEKKRRRDNSLCFYCGSPGHWATTCPQKKRRVATATIEPDGGVPLPTSPTLVPTINSAICAFPAQILYQPKNY